MMRTLSYEFDGVRWVAVAECVPCERGHVHWYAIRRLHRQADPSQFTHDCEYRTWMWRGDALAARGLP